MIVSTSLYTWVGEPIAWILSFIWNQLCLIIFSLILDLKLWSPRKNETTSVEPHSSPSDSWYFHNNFFSCFFFNIYKVIHYFIDSTVPRNVIMKADTMRQRRSFKLHHGDISPTGRYPGADVTCRIPSVIPLPSPPIAVLQLTSRYPCVILIRI